MADDVRDIMITPESVAIVNFRKDEVLTVEDLLVDDEEWRLGCGRPRRKPSGCLVMLRGASRPVRMNASRQEVLRQVDPNRDLFAEFVWRDPDGTKG